MMDLKHNAKNSLKGRSGKNKAFNKCDLDQSVVDKLAEDAEYEARMIAQFNAKANELQPESEPVVPSSNDEEQGGPIGPEPTRYGDWERKGRCYDF